MPASEHAHRRPGLGYLAFFALAAIILTWPVVLSPARPISIRPDYFSNLWNFWWVKTSVLLEHTSPYWTDYLYFPAGISLARHTLSPLNSFAGAALSTIMNPHAAYSVLLLLHFALSGWALFLLAHYLTGNIRGSLLAGLVYSFCPFHYSYVAQLNIATLEFLPLAVLYALRVYRDGGVRNTVLMALFTAMIATSSSYWLVYAFIVIWLVALGGKLWSGGTRFVSGLKRIAIASMVAIAVVAVVSMPLVLAVVEDASSGPPPAVQTGEKVFRANDLLGYSWVGPPERVIVSWPTMLGYSTLLLLVLGYREVVRQRFWLLIGAVFLVLSLGSALKVAGNSTGFPLPHRYLRLLPGFAMLRKPDRAFLMIQFVTALLCAFSWRHLSRLFKSPRRRLACWIVITCVIVVETTGIPFRQFAYECPAYLAGLGAPSGFDPAPEIRSLVHLPVMPGQGTEGRYNYFQTFHHKRIPQGYVTSLAIADSMRVRSDLLEEACDSLLSGSPGPLLTEVEKRDLDLIVIHKIVSGRRPSLIDLERKIVWVPFLAVRRDLIKGRQMGPYVDTPVSRRELQYQKRVLERVLGQPVYEDSDVLVFGVP
ncbi:MAG: hypothetical protein ABIJ00_08360 [Candidatus Eisenbacteria bacterium]